MKKHSSTPYPCC